jgi:nucleotide-binding universal stress UspA family protein
MRIVVWLSEGTWEACVDAARDLGGDVVLVHVLDPALGAAVGGARAGLLGRGSAVDRAFDQAAADAEEALFEAAARRLGRPCSRESRHGRPERELVAACAGADLLVLARDGDHSRLGPASLGKGTRFVVDHAPCRVLLVWPDEPPDLATLPPPPRHPPGPPHGPPPPPA